MIHPALPAHQSAPGGWSASYPGFDCGLDAFAQRVFASQGIAQRFERRLHLVVVALRHPQQPRASRARIQCAAGDAGRSPPLERSRRLHEMQRSRAIQPARASTGRMQVERDFVDARCRLWRRPAPAVVTNDGARAVGMHHAPYGTFSHAHAPSCPCICRRPPARNAANTAAVSCWSRRRFTNALWIMLLSAGSVSQAFAPPSTQIPRARPDPAHPLCCWGGRRRGGSCSAQTLSNGRCGYPAASRNFTSRSLTSAWITS